MAQQRELCFSGHELRDVRAEREVFRVCNAEGRGLCQTATLVSQIDDLDRGGLLM